VITPADDRRAIHCALHDPTADNLTVPIEAMLARGAGFDLKGVCICQDREQLTAIYGQSNTVVANCNTRIVYAPNDYPTAKWVSDLCGQTTAYAEHIMESGRRIGIVRNFTRTFQEVPRPLLLPDEVLTLRKASRDDGGNITAPGEVLILLGGEKPIRADQVFYWQHDEFRRRAAIPAPPDQSLPRTRSGVRGRL
jgi:type IV secretion system protein VirD4